jgi:acetolactate synthase-1/2/3 large subunit
MGMVRQWQELLHGSRYSESYSDALPDFVRLAEAFHARGLRATTLSELDATLQAMIDHPGPVLCEIMVDETENCFPMIPSGAAHNEMILGPEGEIRARGITSGGITDEGLMLV